MEIRPLSDSDLPAASRVLWKSFYEAEKHNTSMDGMERYRDLVDPISLAVNSADGSVLFFGAFDPDLVAVGALKEKGHVLLLYVLPEYAGRGVGSALLDRLESLCETDRVTLNASDGAVPFYEKRGYRKTGERMVQEGMIVTPMEKKS